MSAAEIDLANSERVCRTIAKSHYENFLVGTILLPRRLRQPFFNIYAFCRTADDLADESGDPRTALGHLNELGARLDATFAGSPPAGIFPALRDTIDRFQLPKQPFDDLLSAFRQDQHVQQYSSMEQLLDYCTRSANPVGRIVLSLADSLTPDNAKLSDEICTGLQLANFWQDVARDFKIGRVYLPTELCRRHGVSVDCMNGKTTPPELRRLLAELCDDAESRLRAGLELASFVPRWLSADVRLFAHGGLATINAIRRIDHDVLRQRPMVSKSTQLWLLTRATLRML